MIWDEKDFLKSFVPFLSSKYKNSPSDKIRGARNVVKSTAELLNFMVRDKIVHWTILFFKVIYL